MKNSQIKYYKSLLKEGEYLLLKSNDSFFNNHYSGSPLSILTNFSGTAGEAVIDSEGKIKIFVDTRYHILVEKQVYKDIEIYKMPLGETFFEAMQKCYPKNTIFYLPNDISLSLYMKYSDYFDLRTYKLKEKYLKNNDLNIQKPVFLADVNTKRNSFKYKVLKLLKTNPEAKRQIIFNLDEIAYLTNLRSYQANYSSLFRSILFLDFESKNYILFLDKIPDFEVENLTFMPLKDYSNFIRSIEKPIYINHNDITLSNFLSIKKPKEIKKDNLSLISSIKTVNEIDYIKDCAIKLDKAIANFKAKLKIGLSEYDLSQLFEQELLSTGAICPSFKTILAIDENSASIHYTNTDKNKLLKDGSILLLDCGGYWKNGFATDITRTFYFGKNPKLIHKTVYTYVLKAFINCFLSKETNAKKLDNLARKILKPLENKGFYFNHGLGHGIGTSVHQNPPILSISSKDSIKPYQTHSIEPGLYGGKETVFGVRIENCVYFDLEYKRFSLSKFPLEEILIDYSELNSCEKDFVQKWQKGIFE